MSEVHPTETFREIPGFTGYRIGDMGTVQSCRKRGPGLTFHEYWLPIKHAVGKSGYHFVSLVDDSGKSCNRFVHRLVLETFVGPCPEGMQCRHLDADRSNNCLGNLVWGTAVENAADRTRHGLWKNPRGSNHYRATLTDEKVLAIRRGSAEGRSHRVLAVEFGVAASTISGILCGYRWKHLLPK